MRSAHKCATVYSMTNANVTPFPQRTSARDDIAASVRAHLAVLKISDSELARRTGMSQTQITRRTNARLPFNADELGIVADKLGLSVLELIQMPKPRTPDYMVGTWDPELITLEPEYIAPAVDIFTRELLPTG